MIVKILTVLLLKLHDETYDLKYQQGKKMFLVMCYLYRKMKQYKIYIMIFL